MNSTPSRLVGRLGSVVPPSPVNSNSESSFRVQKASVALRLSPRNSRLPISASREPTSGFTFCAGSPVLGSTVIVVPRASLEGKPVP